MDEPKNCTSVVVDVCVASFSSSFVIPSVVVMLTRSFPTWLLTICSTLPRLTLNRLAAACRAAKSAGVTNGF